MHGMAMQSGLWASFPSCLCRTISSVAQYTYDDCCRTIALLGLLIPANCLVAPGGRLALKVGS